MKKILVFLVLLTEVAYATPVPTAPNQPAFDMTARQKNAAVQPMVRTATECIARLVIATPGLHDSNMGDTIVTSIRSCLTPVSAMIDAYDRYFGYGTGEAFFMGPYLDALPSVVQERQKHLDTVAAPHQ